MLKDFRAFITRGNAIDMSVGIIIGAAFGPIINSLVKDIIMPPIGLLLGKVDFANLIVVLKHGDPPGPYSSLTAAQTAGSVSINYGPFVNTIINFIIVAAAVFLFVVRPIARMDARIKARQPAPVPAAPATKECPFCNTNIPIKATRCPNCTSEISKT
ncbi:MAG: large conductance mechanosensitive channel protein MscL [Dehalococcoidales bacterium]|nr:large conductance mechanosensitive channel protein MscL [Dehalococcoidales bacterium]